MPRAKPRHEGRLGWVGRDMTADSRSRRSRQLLPALVIGCLIAGLGIAWLRVDLIRVRYGLADALHQEKVLLEQQRRDRARLRALRDPTRLARLVERYGLARPKKIIDLPSLTVVVAESVDAYGDRP
ncbi:MAG: hypothetical protein IIA30_00090 [Myxococcales bacterium]|nr:hypothetical protein [Myxococcales bacterium]